MIYVVVVDLQVDIIAISALTVVKTSCRHEPTGVRSRTGFIFYGTLRNVFAKTTVSVFWFVFDAHFVVLLHFELFLPKIKRRFVSERCNATDL